MVASRARRLVAGYRCVERMEDAEGGLNVYRPQFAFRHTPPGFEDEQFHYSFDSTNVPVLGTPIPPGGSAEHIVLQLQNDAEFILRALVVSLIGNTFPVLFTTIRDPYGNYLSAVPLPLFNYIQGAGLSGPPSIGFLQVPFESEIIAPVGGFFELSFYNGLASPQSPTPFTLYGVNRRQLERAA